MKDPNKKKIVAVEIDPKNDDYLNLVKLLSVYSDADNRLSELQTEANNELLESLDEKQKDFAAYQKAKADAESALEVIALKHPDWFVGRKSIVTPYGEVAFRNSTELEVTNPEVTIVLAHSRVGELDRQLQTKRVKGESTDSLVQEIAALRACVKMEEALDKRALGKLDDATLAHLRVKRVPNNNFSVKPANVKLGAAVKEAVEKD